MMTYTGMGRVAAVGLLQLVTKLWPRWKNTPELNAAWVDLFAAHPADVAEAIVRAHVAERTGSPSMPDIAKKLEAARRQSRQIEAGERAKAAPQTGRSLTWPPEHMADVFDMWDRDRSRVEDWLNGLDEEQSRRWRYYLETPVDVLTAHRRDRKGKGQKAGGAA